MLKNKPLLSRQQTNGKYELYQFTDTPSVIGMMGKNTGKVIVAKELTFQNAEYICQLWLKNMEQE